MHCERLHTYCLHQTSVLKEPEKSLFFMMWSVESLSAQVSPAGRVVLLGVEEAGGVQLTAHERGRALIARGLLPALRPRVTVQPTSCSTQHTTLSKQALLTKQPGRT